MLVPLIWSCFCLFAHDYYCVLFIFFLYIFTHCCFDNAKKIKKLVPLFLFFKIIFGDMLVCGLWMWNEWLTLTLWMFWMILWFSFSAQAKTKKEIFALFTTSHAWWQSSVKSALLCQGWLELKLSSSPPIYHLRFHCCCIYNKPPVNTVLNWFETTIKAYQNVYNVMNKFSDWLKIKIV